MEEFLVGGVNKIVKHHRQESMDQYKPFILGVGRLTHNEKVQLQGDGAWSRSSHPHMDYVSIPSLILMNKISYSIV